MKTKQPKQVEFVADSSEEEDSDEQMSEEEEEDDVEVKKNGDQNEEEDDDDDDDSEDDDDDDDEEDDDEKVLPPPAKKKKQQSAEALNIKEETKSNTTKQEGKSKKSNKLAAAVTREVKSEQVKATKTIFLRLPPKQPFNAAKIAAFFKVRDIEVEVRPIKGRNFGFVDLQDSSQVTKALKLNGQRMDGLELIIEMANEKPTDVPRPNKAERRKAEEAEAAKLKLFVKNLTADVTENILKEHFPKATSVGLPLGQDKKNKGYAILVFKTEETAEKVMKKMQGSTIQGHAIQIDFVGAKSLNVVSPTPKSLEDPTKTLFVKQLSFNTTAEDLKKTFKGCASVRLINHPTTGKSRGYGFVTYATAEEAKEARTKMADTSLDGRNIVVSFDGEKVVGTKKSSKGKKPEGERTNGGQKKSNNGDGDSLKNKKTKAVEKSNEKKLKEETTEKAANPKKIKKEKTKKEIKLDIDESDVKPSKRKNSTPSVEPTKKRKRAEVNVDSD